MSLTLACRNFAYTETADVPCAGEGEVTVMVNVSSVNPVEWNGATRGGGEFLGGNGELGQDVGGIVVAVGAGCDVAKDIGPNAYWSKYGYTRPAVQLGDEIWGNTAAEWTFPIAGQAGFAQFSNVYCDRVGIRSRAQAKASAVPITDLGTIPLAAGTSYALLYNAGAPWQPQDDVTVVIASGSGGTGTMAIQEARALGATRVITSSSPNHADRLYELGAEIVIDYHNYDTMFDALPDDSVDVVWDNYGYGFDAAARVIRPGGKYITTSLTSGGAWQQAKRQQDDTTARLAAYIDMSTKPGVERMYTGGWGSPGAPYTELGRMVEAGQLRPVISNRYTLRQAAALYTEAANGHSLGKLALDVPAPDWDPRVIPGWPED
tara:strand:+ start:456 stop:1586 length:1131 start_codon:yes stop_codon:yes gene_type:complete